MSSGRRSRPLFRSMHREGDTVRVEGRPETFEVVDAVAAEQAEFLVCMRLTGNERNRALVAETVLGFCSQCNEPVYWSATAPKAPPRLCLVCFEAKRVAHERSDTAGEPLSYGLTETVLAECDQAEKIVQRQVDEAARSLSALLTMPKPEKTRMN